ncbi:MAG: transposase family protein [Acetatifactor sp.]|nr:transposase family protein [Acetatifactor sp.]
MQEFVNDIDKNYRLDDYRIKEQMVILKISSICKELQCPYCNAISKRVHSIYEREIQDLPMQNKKVILLVKTRKMFCDNSHCQKKTFSERHVFVGAKGKKTVRLEKRIISEAIQLSSINTSNILKSENIDVCKSSVCALLKKNAVHCG